MMTFSRLWENHPTVAGQSNPCSSRGKANYENQCAIRMGVCLVKSGYQVADRLWLRMCGHHPRTAGHVLGAEPLAQAIRTSQRLRKLGVGPMVKAEPRKFSADLKGRTGIIFFKDYWLRKGESHRTRSGDHIDLWNGSRLTDISSLVRIQLRIVIPGTWSDFHEAREVWFWPVD
jgi:hypothetical protein